ncbi:ABC transporter permease [Piscinibacter sakaiensis]|uniref:Taurine transport system permease protein tauC n=2 Tax=Piscinibacter sakaiensis TaxID=1547922 RepID=A0A0K8P488_PISS1|nr:ABC transporter permease [Piscinibacter sakaiensis]GAP37463.1 taurine transport system permease protein tauC [Piscinibacter sakaiensis]
MARPMTRGDLLLSLSGLAGFFVLWQVLAASGLFPPRYLPSPAAVLRTMVELTHDPYSGATLWGHLSASLGRFGTGFLLAAAIGIPLGLLMGWYRWLDDVVSPFFEALRFVAPIAWVPFAGLWFGTGIGGPTLVIFSGAFPPCLINAYRGAKYVDRRLVEAARTLGASGPRIVGEVLLPASLPSIVAGLRVSAGIGWQSLIGAELIVVGSGVGYMMVQGQLNVLTPVVMAGMVAIGLVGVAIDLALGLAERRIQAGWGR